MKFLQQVVQTMLEKFSLTEDNRQDLEDKVDHWNNILYQRFKGPMSEAERFFQKKELDNRMTLYQENKGLSDVFKVFWYLGRSWLCRFHRHHFGYGQNFRLRLILVPRCLFGLI